MIGKGGLFSRQNDVCMWYEEMQTIFFSLFCKKKKKMKNIRKWGLTYMEVFIYYLHSGLFFFMMV
jgi:hypothetical protein